MKVKLTIYSKYRQAVEEKTVGAHSKRTTKSLLPIFDFRDRKRKKRKRK